ncbi:MAG TPA: 50S ribosomal protein L4 [Candidatus Hydrogenedentes bacterium]|jgi:large subunit ribosomal protein L4|nr:50S ribosomal protein L4 [Candidatus Hydrogenedentota bacterium]MDY0032165.1 50S ribosomal protein L4 [FCB group bacterium]NLT59343.1 50S ribosomal protein L4 [Candidatus Hydrogenedentota bacterium]HNV22594.1 50S ribosomal protein L4 [Candidatus Hydrogenedentota bacterium]HNZ19984.1 50S ribosomal protein L4 [Candidatus Hydrogenedentota bacterium]
MAAAKVYKADGSEAGTLDLNDAVFNVPANPTLIKQVAVALRNAKRQGNAETKVRRLVSGGGVKPYRQKGTGNARHGSTREPQMRGGGVVWGPHKRSYRQKVTPVSRNKALCCALSDRLRSESLCVLDALQCDAPKTKPMASMLAHFRPNAERTLLVTAETTRPVLLSSRNIPRVTVRTASDVNALDVLEAKRIVVVQDAVAKLEERLS